MKKVLRDEGFKFYYGYFSWIEAFNTTPHSLISTLSLVTSKLSKFQVDLCISVTVLAFHLFTFFPLLPIFQIPERFQAATKPLQLKWVGSGVLESTGTVLGLLALHSPCLGAEFLRLTDFCNGFIIWLKEMLFKGKAIDKWSLTCFKNIPKISHSKYL